MATWGQGLGVQQGLPKVPRRASDEESPPRRASGLSLRVVGGFEVGGVARIEDGVQSGPETSQIQKVTK